MVKPGVLATVGQRTVSVSSISPPTLRTVTAVTKESMVAIPIFVIQACSGIVTDNGYFLSVLDFGEIKLVIARS